MTLDHSSQPSSQESTLAEKLTAPQQPTPITHLPPIDPAIQPLRWLWPDRIPFGKLTLLDGSPGCGTTLFAVTLAAHVSRGRPFPDGTACPQGNVLFLAPHDNFRDTLLPRVIAAGADDGHVMSLSHVLDDPPARDTGAARGSHPFSLSRDLPFLESLITQMQIVLLILDPYTAFPGWRRALPALIDLAQRTHCAIVLTRSLGRSPADPLHPRVPASAILTAARSHFLLAPDPRDERHCLLLTPKHSLSAAPTILAYTITTSEHNQPVFSWLPAPNLTHLRRLCTGPIRSPHRRAILQFLRECPNPCPVKEILAATSYDYEAGRKMLLRMSQAGELVSPASGLYTTANHPCLANISLNSLSPNSSSNVPVPNVPVDSSTSNEQSESVPVGADSSRPAPIHRLPVDPNDSQPDPFNINPSSTSIPKNLTNVPCPDNHPLSHVPATLIPTPPSSPNTLITSTSEKNMENVPHVPTTADQSPSYQKYDPYPRQAA